MPESTTIGLDIAKQVFQVHGTDKSGRTVLRRKLRRSEVIGFSSAQPACVVRTYAIMAQIACLSSRGDIIQCQAAVWRKLGTM